MKPLPQLKDIRLEKWVNFYLLYGKELDRRYSAILSMPDCEEKTDLYMLYEVESAQQTYSYYAGVLLDEVELMDVKELLITYSAAFLQWNQAVYDSAVNIYSGILWNGEVWELQPIGKDANKTSFAEFEHTQTVSLLFADMEEGRVDRIYTLFAMFFRKEGEPFTEAIPDRIEIMKSLPLDIAYAIKEVLTDADRN